MHMAKAFPGMRVCVVCQGAGKILNFRRVIFYYEFGRHKAERGAGERGPRDAGPLSLALVLAS
jgi:hypothetical protein